MLMGLVDLETGEPLHIVVVGATAGYEEVRVRVRFLVVQSQLHSLSFKLKLIQPQGSVCVGSSLDTCMRCPPPR